jgi:hypothetical protein
MANTTDAAFVEDIDVDQEIRSRNLGSKNTNPLYMPNKSGATSPGLDSDNENAPLLSPSGNDYGSANGNSNNNGGQGWDGDADFRGLPWWKRPSVGTGTRYSKAGRLTGIDILAAPAIPPIHHSVRWYHST